MNKSSFVYEEQLRLFIYLFFKLRAPLTRSTGTVHKRNGIVLPEMVSDSVDRQMDAEQMDIDVEDIPLASLISDVSPAQSRGKRKARKPVIKDEESDEEVVPKVGQVESYLSRMVGLSIMFRVNDKK